NAQISILEDLARQLRSGIRTIDEEVSRLRNLARIHGEGEASRKLPADQTGIQWSDVIWGRKVADRGTSSEWEQKDLNKVCGRVSALRLHD
ncbi:hypothetical protein HYDPIDRAFT_130087, partial [Hydnomerulius pinastri MD-312]